MIIELMLQSVTFHATLFYQQVQKLNPIEAMLRFLPMPVSGVICNVLVAWVIARVPTQILVCIGILATGCVSIPPCPSFPSSRVFPPKIPKHAHHSLASVLFAIAPADVSYWRLPFNAMWMCVLGADL
jgi:hypothetical protein